MLTRYGAQRLNDLAIDERATHTTRAKSTKKIQEVTEFEEELKIA